MISRRAMFGLPLVLLPIELARPAGALPRPRKVLSEIDFSNCWVVRYPRDTQRGRHGSISGSQSPHSPQYRSG